MRLPGGFAAKLQFEAIIAAVFVGVSAVIGGLGGIVWDRLAPHIPLLQQFAFEPAVEHTVFGQQLLYADVMIGAAVLILILLGVLRRWSAHTHDWTSGPGAILGLAGGGLVGSLVAAAVGRERRLAPFLAQYHRTIAPSFDHMTKVYYLRAFEFRLHAVALIVVWPLIAVVVHGVRCWATAEPLTESAVEPAGLDKLVHRAVTD